MSEQREKTRASRRLASAILVAALAAIAVAGTWAWITATSDPVVNTFTYGDISITLAETDSELDADNDANTNTYKMMPGADISKDPLITVKDGSEACYLFVKMDESANFSDFIQYTMADGWIQLTDDQGADIAGVYYRTLDAVTNADASVQVLADNKVTVKNDITRTQLTALGNDLPTLSITAYAVQQEGMGNAYAAWSAAVGA